MTWLPIATINPQYVDEDGLPYVGAVLKAYSAGTSTNINLATDNTGGTTATSIALNAKGYPEVSGTQVIPHVEESYKLSLYPTQADADSDTSAIWTIDNLTTPINTEVVDLETTVDKSTSYTAVLADKRKTINVTAAATISLGDASTMGTDYRISVKNSHTAAITVDLDTALDTIDGTAGASVSLEPNEAGTFTTTAGADGYKIQSSYPDPSQKMKIIDIGDWDMTATLSVAVAHGLTLSTIRSVDVQIRSNSGSLLLPLDYEANSVDAGYFRTSAASVTLTRDPAGEFALGSYDSTSYNRGWITIWYVV